MFRRLTENYERLFSCVSFAHLQAYQYQVDEPLFRLLAPHQDHFVRRQALLDRVQEALASRHFLVALDGLGGVGKSALAIELVKSLYNAED